MASSADAGANGSDRRIVPQQIVELPDPLRQKLWLAEVEQARELDREAAPPQAVAPPASTPPGSDDFLDD